MSINYLLRFDGASRGNPGHSSYGFVLYSVDEYGVPSKIYSEGFYMGKATNNQAEYRALLEGVNYCKRKGITNIRIEGDSELIINQVRGIWLVRDKILRVYYDEIVSALPSLVYVELKHIERIYNKDADNVCNTVLNNFLKR